MKTALRLTRWGLDGALIALVLTVLSLAIAANIGPGFGHRLVVIRGSSMSPAIPLGSVVDLVTVKASDLRVGDVVMLQSPDGGTRYTHRINRIVTLPDGVYVETEGDAVGKPDAPLEPISIVQGRVDVSLPLLGFLVYMLSTPMGVMAILFLALTMLLFIWLLEDVQDDWFGNDSFRSGRGRRFANVEPQPKLRESRIGQWAG